MCKMVCITLLLCLSQVVVAQKIHLPQYDVAPGENQVTRVSGDSLSTGFFIVIPKVVKLHKHLYHSEHVYVNSGTGEMVLGDSVFTIKTGDWIFIPKNTPHKVTVNSKEPLHVMSIQSPYFDGKDRVLLE